MLASYHERGGLAPVRGDGVSGHLWAECQRLPRRAGAALAGKTRRGCKHGATGMAGRLFVLLALVVVIAAAWAALVTLLVPPLTFGWRGFYEAMVRRWVRNVAVLGVGTVLVFALWLLFLALRCRVSRRSCAAADADARPARSPHAP